MTEDDPKPPPSGPNRGLKPLVLGGISLAVLAVLVVAARVYVFPGELVPVRLSPGEERVLAEKLDRMNPGGPGAKGEPGPLEPERYAEEGARREVRLTQREVNALLEKTTDLGRTLAIHFSDGLVSAKILIPLGEDVPVVGGRTLKVTAGLELAFADGRPRVVLKGISLMGVPIPNSWLGELKNVDLVEEFEASGGFWKAFAAGVADLRVEEGALRVRLRE